MPWESEEEQVRQGRDWARIMWLGVAAILIIGVALMFMPRRGGTTESRAHVKQILIAYGGETPSDLQAAYDTAASLRKRIVNGESFTKLAEEYSSDKNSAARGGDLGWVHHSELSDEIDEWIWSAPLDQVSEPIPTGYGVHLVMVVGREISDAEKYEDQLKQRVLEDRGHAADAQ